jgi:AhpD family alkylhydroperoxidase
MAPRVAPATGPFARLSVAIARRQYGAPMVESALVHARHPRLVRSLMLYNRAVEKQGRVPRLLCDLAVLKAATVVECEFCIDIGSEYLRREGLSDEQLLALPRYRESELFTHGGKFALDVDDANLVVDLAHVHRHLCLGHVTHPFPIYLLYLRVFTAQGLQRPGQVIVVFSLVVHQDTDASLRALSSSGKTLTKSERRVMLKIST